MTEPTPAPGNSTAAEHTPASAVDSPLTTGATPDSGPVTAAAGGASDADSATATGEKVESHGHQEDEEADDDRPLGQRLAYEAAERRMREESLRTLRPRLPHHIVGGALFETHGGDINVGLERSETIKRHLVGEQLAREIENTFVPTSSYNKLVSQLAVEQVVVLKGHESSGRFWTALAAPGPVGGRETWPAAPRMAPGRPRSTPHRRETARRTHGLRAGRPPTRSGLGTAGTR